MPVLTQDSNLPLNKVAPNSEDFLIFYSNIRNKFSFPEN